MSNEHKNQCSFNSEETMQTQFHEGDISSGTCHICRKPVTTRFETRSIRLKRSSVTFPNILVSVCTYATRPLMCRSSRTLNSSSSAPGK